MDKLKSILDSIKQDQLSGSIVLLQKLIDGFKDLSSAWDDIKDLNTYQIISILSEFQSDMSDFIVMNHFLNEIIDRIKRSGDIVDLGRWCSHYEYEWKDIADRMAGNFLETVELSKKNVLLHSNSGTIHSIFNQLKDKDLSINLIQTESRPNNEGVLQAEQLAAMGYPIRLTIDASTHQVMDEVDLIILGADSIYQDYFINKIGSYPIVSAARQFQVPVFVIADSRKFWTSVPATSVRKWNGPVNYNPEEVYSGSVKGIEVINHYFESIPNRYVTAFITENQVFRPGELWEF
ncbi:MAG: hypothetical protein ACEPOW_03020 [Bacteroidales bacterium]